MQNEQNLTSSINGIEIVKKEMTADEIRVSDPRFFLAVTYKHDPRRSGNMVTATVWALSKGVSLKEKIAICQRLSISSTGGQSVADIKSLQFSKKMGSPEIATCNEVAGPVTGIIMIIEAIAFAMIKKGIQNAFFPAGESKEQPGYLIGVCDKSGSILRMNPVPDRSVRNIRFFEDRSAALYTVGGEIRCIKVSDIDKRDWAKSSNHLTSFAAPVGYLGRVRNEVVYATLENGKAFEVSVGSSSRKELIFQEKGFVPSAITALETGLLAVFGKKNGEPVLIFGDASSVSTAA